MRSTVCQFWSRLTKFKCQILATIWSRIHYKQEIIQFLVEQPKTTLRKITNNSWVAGEYKKKEFSNKFFIWIIDPCTPRYSYTIQFLVSSSIFLHYSFGFTDFTKSIHCPSLAKEKTLCWKILFERSWQYRSFPIPCITSLHFYTLFNFIWFITLLSSDATEEAHSRDTDQTWRVSRKHHMHVQ